MIQIENISRWNAVMNRDRAYDGKFLFGVLTTGVYCRPSCPARRPLRKNVRFYDTPTAAERDGLRPCLRCQPRSSEHAPHVERILKVADHIEKHCEESLTLRDLGQRAGLSAFQFQRSFKAVLGLTPRQYGEMCRMGSMKKDLRANESVLGSIYASGFGSTSRAYEKTDSYLGMTPTEYRDGGKGVAITHATMDTRLGLLLIAATARGLCFVQFGETKAQLEERLKREYPSAEITPMATANGSTPVLFAQWTRALRDYIDGNSALAPLPLDVRATAFQARVWRFLQQIPGGQVKSYSEVAAGIGQPKAARAVASACAKNVVALAIPCHRVIRGTGDPGGYRWGGERKQKLIEQERHVRSLD